MESTVEKPEIIITLENEPAENRDFSKTDCPGCGSLAEWHYEAWDLDREMYLVHFGFYVCPKCRWKSGLRTRKFKFTDEGKRFGLGAP